MTVAHAGFEQLEKLFGKGHVREEQGYYNISDYLDPITPRLHKPPTPQELISLSHLVESLLGIGAHTVLIDTRQPDHYLISLPQKIAEHNETVEKLRALEKIPAITPDTPLPKPDNSITTELSPDDPADKAVMALQDLFRKDNVTYYKGRGYCQINLGRKDAEYTSELQEAFNAHNMPNSHAMQDTLKKPPQTTLTIDLDDLKDPAMLALLKKHNEDYILRVLNHVSDAVGEGKGVEWKLVDGEGGERIVMTKQPVKEPDRFAVALNLFLKTELIAISGQGNLSIPISKFSGTDMEELRDKKFLSKHLQPTAIAKTLPG